MTVKRKSLIFNFKWNFGWILGQHDILVLGDVPPSRIRKFFFLSKVTFELADVPYQQWRIQDFPLGGAGQLGQALISDTGTFWQKHVQKWKNWILLGGEGACRWRSPWICQWSVPSARLFNILSIGISGPGFPFPLIGMVSIQVISSDNANNPGLSLMTWLIHYRSNQG